MSEVQRAIHVRVWKVAEPFGVFFFDLGRGKAFGLFESGSIDLEDTLVLPLLLVLSFEGDQGIALSSLKKRVNA